MKYSVKLHSTSLFNFLLSNNYFLFLMEELSKLLLLFNTQKHTTLHKSFHQGIRIFPIGGMESVPPPTNQKFAHSPPTWKNPPSIKFLSPFHQMLYPPLNKNFEWSKSLLLRFPPPPKKSPPAKFPISLTLFGKHWVSREVFILVNQYGILIPSY